MGRLMKYMLVVWGFLMVFFAMPLQEETVLTEETVSVDCIPSFQQEKHPAEDTLNYLLSDRFAVTPQSGIEVETHHSAQLKFRCITLLTKFLPGKETRPQVLSACHPSEHIRSNHAIDYYIYTLERIII